MQLPLYDQLSFLLPGGILLATGLVGGWGWPWGEPGAAASAGLLAAAYAVGHINAAAARWLAPIAFGRWPGSSVPPSWGLFGPNGLYDGYDEQEVRDHFARFGSELSFDRQYAVAATSLQQRQLDGPLTPLNAQIGFYRNMATALLLAILMIGGWALAGRTHLPWTPWVPIGAIATVAYASGLRRFWRRYGDQTVRSVLALATRQD